MGFEDWQRSNVLVAHCTIWGGGMTMPDPKIAVGRFHGSVRLSYDAFGEHAGGSGTARHGCIRQAVLDSPLFSA